MSLYRWLHISDLHFITGDDPDQENMIATLLTACKNGKIQADFVIATGDFHNFTDRDNFKPAKTFLQSLINALKLDISSDLFLVPGNHDQQPSSSKKKFMRDIMKNIKKGEPFDYASNLTANSANIAMILDDFCGYSQMASSLVEVYNPAKACSMKPETVHVRTWNNSINLLHMNTAILSDGRRDHAEGLDIATVCSPHIREQLDNGRPTLVLGHHSFFDLHSTIRDRLIQLFNQTNVWAYLAGDRHRLNYHGEDYLIDRKIGIAAWPNIVAGKMAASVEDSYSQFCILRYCWDTDKNTVTPEHLIWEQNSSGAGFTTLGWEALRPFPMYAEINSKLYFDLMECLVETRRTHPSFQLMEIDETFYPKGFRRFELSDCRAVGDKIEEAHPLADFFRESWISSTQNHLILEGEGGIGKTVALLSLATQEGLLPHNVPAVYIPLNRLKISEGNGIDRYIRDEIFRGDDSQFDELVNLANKRWEKGPCLVLLTDGFNEISFYDRYAVARDIEKWSRKRGVQIIVSSRFDVRAILSGLSGEYRSIRLLPLSRNILKGYLDKNCINPPNEDSSLWEIIDYPLMLTLYVQTETVREQKCAVPLDWRVAKTAGSIIWNYLQQELLRCTQLSEDYTDILNSVVATEYFAPYIAWQMVKNNQFVLTEDEFEEYLFHAIEYWKKADRSAFPKHIRQVMRHTGGPYACPGIDTQFEILTKRLNLFRIQKNATGNIIRMMHQRFRDCFAAIHLINLAHAMPLDGLLPEEWRNSVNHYVMNFVAELIDHCEADCLWNANRTQSPTNSTSTRTMLELQKRRLYFDFSGLNFSGMDLRKIHLYAYRLPGKTHLDLPTDSEMFDNCHIGVETFIKEGHTQFVTAVEITPDGSCCVSSSMDNSLRIWDMATGACLQVLEAHKYRVNNLTISRDGNRCISASWDNTMRIWDMITGACLHVLKGHKHSVNAVTITPDGSRCVSASDDKTLRIWDMAAGTCLHELQGHKQRVSGVAITSDGSRCVSTSDDDTLRIWDIATGVCLRVLESHTGNVTAVAITSDDSCCVSTSSDCTLRVWDLATGDCLHVLIGHKGTVNTVIITPDGSRCISTSNDNTLRIWSMETGECLQELKEHKQHVTAVSITPDGSRCVSASEDSTVRIWDMATGECLYVLQGHKGKITAVAVTPNSNRCVSASEDSTLCIWDMVTGACLHVLQGRKEHVIVVTITRDGSRCISASEDNLLRIWDMATWVCLHVLQGHMERITSVAITPDDSRCVSASWDNTMRIWDIITGACLHVLEGHKRRINVVTITPDGSRCISASDDETLRIWDMATGTCLHELQGHMERVNAVVITSDGSRCVSASDDRTLCIWDMATGKCLHVLQGHKERVNTIAITPNDSCCVSASGDSTLRVWNMTTGACLHTLEGHAGSVKSIVITPDGSRCVSMSVEHTLRIWNIITGAFLYLLEIHMDDVNALAITPDGSHCVSASKDSTLRIWNIATGMCLQVLEGHVSGVTAIAISPRGSHCVSSSDDSTMRIWDMVTCDCLNVIHPIQGLSLLGVNLKKAIITPPEYAETLRQNGAIV